MILFRYFAREILVTMIGITAVLLLVFIGNQVIHFLRIAAEGKIASTLLIHIISLQIPYFIGLLLPMGLFFAVLFTLGRMYVDNEMVVLFASGYTLKQLYKAILTVVLIVAIVSGVLILWINPYIAIKRDYYSSGHASNSVFDMVMPGRFQSAMGNNLVFYVENMSDHRQKVKNFFMAERPSHDRTANALGSGWSVVSAADAVQTTSKTGDRYIVARNGYRYQGVPGHKDYSLIKFKSYGVRIPDVPASVTSNDVQTKSTLSLLWTSQHSLSDMAELQWRFSLIIGAFLLGFLAIPLSKVNPRQGRYAQFVPAVLICLLYVNMLFVARAWVNNGSLPPWIGMWSVHLILLLVILVWIVIQRKYREFL